MRTIVDRRKKGKQRMLTQKDMHNIIVKTFDEASKFSLIKSCGADIDEIKKFEQQLADTWNNAEEMVEKAIEYMSKEI